VNQLDISRKKPVGKLQRKRHMRVQVSLAVCLSMLVIRTPVRPSRGRLPPSAKSPAPSTGCGDARVKRPEGAVQRVQIGWQAILIQIFSSLVSSAVQVAEPRSLKKVAAEVR
jgi:hypothetical protein